MSPPGAGCGTDRSLQLGRRRLEGLGLGLWKSHRSPHSASQAVSASGRAARQPSPHMAAECAPSHPDLQSPLARKEKGKNVLVDVTRRGGSGGWTAGGSDEDRCLLTPSTLTEFVFHKALAEEAV